MTPVETLIERVQAYNPNANFGKIRRAYDYGRDMHEGQLRHSGEPYFTHPIQVAMILAEQKLDDASIITALLHDTLEDTHSTHHVLIEQFGEEVTKLVDGVTKLTKLELSKTTTIPGANQPEKDTQNFRKLFLAMSEDLRVVLVKLADRLHNMRTIKHMPSHKQSRKAQETMDIFAPLAGRMGMQSMREELEDRAFQILNPKARKSIMRRFVSMRDDSDDVIPRIISDLKKELKTAGINATISGREKKPYSIWRKMEEKKLSFSRLSDIFGFRIIVENNDELYHALGVVHQRWTAVPGRFKDYVSAPKTNGYRSIHTTVSGRDGKRVEIQIRTTQMHEVAETGIAAHWAYRDDKLGDNPFIADTMKWVNAITAQMTAPEDHENFLEHVKLEMFADQVFCFTPKGDVVNLPKNATPLDFAFAIHTRIGLACQRVKIDGHRAPIWTKLRNGQSVEIETAKTQQLDASWLEIAITGRARAIIRRALRDQNQAKHEKLGLQMARVALDHIGKPTTNKALDTAAEKLNLRDRHDMLARIGMTELSVRDMTQALYPTLLHDSDVEQNHPKTKIIGFEADQTVNRATCCQPLPGERIVGITDKGRGVTVHSIYCQTLEKYHSSDDRWLDLHWSEGQSEAKTSVTLDVVMANYKGVLARVCALIAEQDSNIVDLKVNAKQQDFYQIAIDVTLRDVTHLSHVVTALEADTDIAQVIQTHRQGTQTY